MIDLVAVSAAAVVGGSINAVNSKLFDISKPQAAFAYHIGFVAAAFPLPFVNDALIYTAVKYGVPDYICIPSILTLNVIGMHKLGKAAAKWCCNTDVTLKDSLKLGVLGVVALIPLAAIAVSAGIAASAGQALIGSYRQNLV